MEMRYTEMLAEKGAEMLKHGYSRRYVSALERIVRDLESTGPPLPEITLSPKDIYEAQEQCERAGKIVDRYIEDLKARLVVAAWLSCRENIHDEWVPHVGQMESTYGFKAARYLERRAKHTKSASKRRVLIAEAREMEKIAVVIQKKHERIYISPPL